MDRRDSEHIFSEFEDVERQRYIREIIAKNPSLGRVTRRSLFILWFSCKEILREWARQDAMSPINLALIGSRPDLESDVVGRSKYPKVITV